jgi:hypothetical protein
MVGTLRFAHPTIFSAIHLQRRNEGFLRDVDLAELPHLLLAFLLLLQKLAFAGDVAAVAFLAVTSLRRVQD